MFKLFKPKEYKCPITQEQVDWMNNAFAWLVENFGEENIKNRCVLRPHVDDFPIKYSSDESTAHETIKIIAAQMEVAPDEIELDIYSEGEKELTTGGAFGNRIFISQVDGEKYSSGKYWGKEEDNKYHIGIEKQNLKDPEKMIATMAHEIAHIKLLGEKRIEKNNEPLTDLTTIIFDLGVFNANVAFRYKKDFESWGYSSTGYLSQMEWGYALALFALLRGEESPEWLKYLTTNVKSDLKKSILYIQNKKD